MTQSNEVIGRYKTERDALVSQIEAMDAKFYKQINDLLNATAQPSPSEPFIPEEGQEYWAWVIGRALLSDWHDNEANKAHLATDNVHRTKEEAEAYGAWLQSPVTQARRRLEGLPGYDVGGECGAYYERSTLKRCNSYSEGYSAGNPRFKTAEQRDYAMKHHEADLVMVLRGED